ncbi:MAG: TRAM domain-containing protein [candidate division NC10 bacterium]|nr:TRAM domain-containing protein [candidate division NC10 bacterium]
MIGGGAAIGFSLALQASVGPNQWLLRLAGLLLGAWCGAVVNLLQRKFHQTSVTVIISGIIGFVLGLGLAELFFGAIAGLFGFIPAFIAMTMRAMVTIGTAYLGAAVAIEKSPAFSMAHLARLVREAPHGKGYKILDTSVLIDGRIADICEAGFLEGTLLIPQCVLRGLQQVADSSDPLTRNRGHLGLDLLQRIQKKLGVPVEISDIDFPEFHEVDAKLIALAKTHHAKVVTNDLNLYKVAMLHGIGVLHINELTTALKPMVLAGDELRVYILKEGKEYNQGIAYLDDGTMVIVDGGRRHIGQTVEVCVTSVVQTAAGRLVFCRLKEEAEAA